MTDRIIDQLNVLGFSRYEAQAYIALLRNSPLNGYELARASGVPRPNIYGVLGRLSDRGAVMRVEGESATRFVPVASGELVRRLRRDFERTLEETEQSLGRIGERLQWEPVANSRGREAAIALAKDVVRESRGELMLAVWPQEAAALEGEVAEADARGVKVATLCLAGCLHACGNCHGEVHRHRIDPHGNTRWLVLAADGRDVITAELTETDALSVRSRQRLLVELAVWYIRHTIAVASLVKDLNSAGSQVLSPETRAILRSIGARDSGHQWLSQMHEILDRTGSRPAE